MLAATNRADAIDPAILSRLTEQIEITLPDQEQRKQLIEVFLSGVSCDKVADIADRLAQPQLTANYSGRDLGQLVNRAILAAVKRSGDVRTFRLQWSDFAEGRI
jgi:transitional endoplasmic reticulum ATPase